jgi:hypothetical protein
MITNNLLREKYNISVELRVKMEEWMEDNGTYDTSDDPIESDIASDRIHDEFVDEFKDVVPHLNREQLLEVYAWLL